MRGLAGCRAGLIQLRRQDVQPLAQHVGPSIKAPLEGGLPGCAAGAVTGQTTRLNGSDHTSINSLWLYPDAEHDICRSQERRGTLRIAPKEVFTVS